eukprot:g30002.t1
MGPLFQDASGQNFSLPSEPLLGYALPGNLELIFPDYPDPTSSKARLCHPQEVDGPRVAYVVADVWAPVLCLKYASGGLILKAMQDRRERGSQDDSPSLSVLHVWRASSDCTTGPSGGTNATDFPHEEYRWARHGYGIGVACEPWNGSPPCASMELEECGAWRRQIWLPLAKDGELLRPALGKILKAEIGPIQLHQTAGERFTGGTSTPVWKLRFVAKRGRLQGWKRSETQLVAKWVKPSTELRRCSYVNEKQFYLSAGPLVRKAGARLPHMLMCDESPKDGICFLFDDLTVDFPLHPESLDVRGARASLSWLARFHASFWEADAAGSFPAGMTTLADYWGLAKGENEERLGSAGALNASSKVLKAHGVWEVAKTLGPRLQAAAKPLDAVLRKSKGFVKYRTLLHGDFKTANFFLRDTEDGCPGRCLEEMNINQ